MKQHGTAVLALLAAGFLCPAGDAAAAGKTVKAVAPPPATATIDTRATAYRQCLTLIAASPESARLAADRWWKDRAALAALHCRALAEYSLQKYNDAAADFDSLHDMIAPADQEERLNLRRQSANAWIAAGRPDQALFRLSDLIKQSTGEAPALVQLRYEALLTKGDLERQQGRMLTALQDFDHAVSLGVSPEKALMARAHLFHAMGMNKLAAADARSALALAPGNTEAASLLKLVPDNRGGGG